MDEESDRPGSGSRLYHDKILGQVPSPFWASGPLSTNEGTKSTQPLKFLDGHNRCDLSLLLIQQDYPAQEEGITTSIPAYPLMQNQSQRHFWKACSFSAAGRKVLRVKGPSSPCVRTQQTPFCRQAPNWKYKSQRNAHIKLGSMARKTLITPHLFQKYTRIHKKKITENSRHPRSHLPDLTDIYIRFLFFPQ